ncbi:sulfotransferase domain-containing protein [Planktomarina temperata]|nr:sulfotransferase domain-containing protein [Planktomarina temperata]
MREKAELSGLIYLDLDMLISYSGLSVKKISDSLIKLPKYGCLVGPIRSPRAPRFKNNVRTISVVRDPRDVIISQYYSLKFSHGIISRYILETRTQLQTLELNEYLFSSVGNKIINDTVAFMDEALNCNLNFKYEDLIKSETERTRLNNAVADGHKTVKIPLSSATNSSKSKHHRSGASGQWQVLEMSSQEYLNEQFDIYLKRFRYCTRSL